jgi:hypothetical protein
MREWAYLLNRQDSLQKNDNVNSMHCIPLQCDARFFCTRLGGVDSFYLPEPHADCWRTEPLIRTKTSCLRAYGCYLSLEHALATTYRNAMLGKTSCASSRSAHSCSPRKRERVIIPNRRSGRGWLRGWGDGVGVRRDERKASLLA